MTDATVEVAGEAPVVSPARYKGIAILGSQPVTKMAAPYDDPEWLIYACSPDNSPAGRQGVVPPRWDVWFELHKPIAHTTRSYSYLRWLEQQDCPKIMRDKEAIKLFPKATLYPEEELKNEFGWPIFTSSVAYMLAKAIKDCEALGIKQIGLFGILQAANTEYHKHLIGTQQFIWLAKKRGIKVGAPHPESIPAVDRDGNFREDMLRELAALKQMFTPMPEDW